MKRTETIRIKCPHCYEMTFRSKPILDEWRCPKCKTLHQRHALRLGGWIAVKAAPGLSYGYETLRGDFGW